MGQNEELDEFIGLAHHLVIDLGAYNVIAPKAAEALMAIRRRTDLKLQHSGDTPSPTPGQYAERASLALTQPQPSLPELLGPECMADSLWASTAMHSFSKRFPGIEILCTPPDPELPLNNFFDSCLHHSNESQT